MRPLSGDGVNKCYGTFKLPSIRLVKNRKIKTKAKNEKVLKSTVLTLASIGVCVGFFFSDYVWLYFFFFFFFLFSFAL